ncbi:NUDIX hydrolase [Streptacidiphilus sp. N1-3]|uniref:NUDIX hydrolase n=1 Tax=Streptacidiphilus alkalitolerans TaxID=3342712 RepID=A0ABV6WX40_9ACTN
MILQTVTVPWIPVRHRMDVVLTPRIPEGYTVTTAFVLALDADNRTLLTHVDRPDRGWEVPGGHLDPGESPLDAAVRELAEETGLHTPPPSLTPLGGLQITLLEDPPPTYTYPTHAFMAFYTLRLPTRGEDTTPHPTSECTQAAWFDTPLPTPSATWLPLHATLLA